MKITNKFEELKNVAGIYKLTIGTYCYIGQSKNLQARLKQHLLYLKKVFIAGKDLTYEELLECDPYWLNKNLYPKMYFYASYVLKLNLETFLEQLNVEILEVIKPSKMLTKNLLDREQYYIEKYLSYFNGFNALNIFANYHKYIYPDWNKQTLKDFLNDMRQAEIYFNVLCANDLTWFARLNYLRYTQLDWDLLISYQLIAINKYQNDPFFKDI